MHNFSLCNIVFFIEANTVQVIYEPDFNRNLRAISIVALVVFVIICPIAIAYSIGQIIKSVCVRVSVCLCVCPSVGTLTVAFLDRFSPKLAQT